MATKKRVLIADVMSPKAAEVFKERGIDVDVRPGLDKAALKACLGDYDGLAVRSTTKVTGDLLKGITRLRVIGRAGVGVDTIDVPQATAQGVVVMNAPLGNAITTAEHAIAMIMSLARQIPQANASTHLGKWEKSRFMGVEISAKTLGLVGCGNIGSVVADRAQGLKMKVISYDPYLTLERAKVLGVEKVELDDLYRRADFITLHVPLTDATRRMIDTAALGKMKRGVRLVNCARGELVVEADLKAALESGQVAAAALDVFVEEPAKTNLLFGMDSVVATPHLGASTVEAQEKVAIQIAEQMADFLLTGAVSSAVNMPSVTAEEAPRLKPYLELARQLGSFVGQLTETAIKAVTIEYAGRVSELNTRPMTAAALHGLLSPLLETVNMVNALIVAKERGIAVREVRHEQTGPYHTMIRLEIATERQSHAVSGTLFGADRPRIVDINGIPIDAEVGPHMLYITNQDKPGFIGAIGTLLGNAGINIATFNLGRSAPQGEAIALVGVDSPTPEPIMQKIRALPHVLRVQALRFDGSAG
ncbi:MAG: phosphoglycerate dehydrogenase [Rhodospirillales bacterium]|nr:phosphoglycerate dehydrogenase [Rhodospirillales bacterium]